MASLIRVLIVSDYPMVRAGLQSLLAGQDGLAVIGQVASGEQLLEAVIDLRPDVVVIELAGERADLANLERLGATMAGIGIVVVSGNASADFVAGALAAGARGFLLKEAAGDELGAAAQAVYRGLLALDPAVARRILHPTTPSMPQDSAETLTPRELEVVALLARGLPNKAIANALHLSEHTVKFHVASIMGKLGAASRTEAVTIAARQGLIAL